jgi:CheY-like chemotaxis protein
VLQRVLEGNGFRVWLAADGPTGVELYRQHRDAIAVVLLDVCMPGLDGPQTLDALRQVDPDVSACFMSADLGGHCPEELLKQGARHLLAKPIPLDELLGVLELLVSRAPVSAFRREPPESILLDKIASQHPGVTPC